MRAIFSLLFWIFFAISSALLFCVALVIFLVTLPFDPKGRVQHLFSCAWAQLYFWVNPTWRLHVQGREKLPWRSAAVIVANHQSLGDILVLFGLYRPFKWVSKASVFRAPFLGWNMRLNRYVPLQRGDKGSIAKMMAACETWLERGVPVLLFPEGTRSPDGNLLPFKDGAFRLAAAKGCPVIPIAITGTADTLPKHGLVIRRSAACRVHVLDAVDPAPFGGDVAALREHVRALIAAEKARMESGEEVRRAA
ncbi:lysophospholipid acyltransferase family protein [Vulgatibacter sp.]|uniref:lysophospholipid acyltransferase family protein n=1 Tax=Vulgatibacter sp. TaxID=1971226 RepID=UPI0035658714